MWRILIVDDDEYMRDMLQQTLERDGCEVTLASDGDDGLAKLDKEKFDLVITDIFMPRKEGIGLIVELREKYPNLKVIAISGGGRVVSPDYLPIAEKLGAHRTLAKPFSRQEIIDMIHDLLEES